ncbi:MAG: hypothetical protein ACO2OQ_01955 [Thermofilaceae archaeon]|jgi:hypothetical protein
MSEERFIGASVEREVRRLLEQELAENPKALSLALQILEAYTKGGRKGVAQLVRSLVEGEAGAGPAEEPRG